MAKSNKKVYFLEVTSLTLVGLALFILMVPPLVTPYFVSVDSYINNSETIELNKVEYIDWENVNIGASQSKDVYTIKANNIYYGLEFYQKGKYEGSSSNLSQVKVNERVFIRLNPIELDRHNGTIEDPIPVYNYGLIPDELFWDAEKYEYNIRTHLTFEEILHIKSYEWILWIILITFTPLVIYNSIKSRSEENARDKAASQSKKNEERLDE